MDLSLTPEQEMLKTAVRSFVQQEYPKETLLQIASPTESTPNEPWEQLIKTGWLGILIPTEYGGEGGSFTDAGVLFEELGRGPVPGPHLSSAVVAALTLLEGGTEEQKNEWLPLMATGEVRMVVAITEDDFGWLESDVQLSAEQTGSRLTLNGSKSYVFDGETATHFICAFRSKEDNEVGLVILPADSVGITIRHLPGFAWNQSAISMEDVAADSINILGEKMAGGWAALERAELKAIPVLCAYQVGGSQAVYELSVDYSRTRHQFGTPIGRFQRVQDQVINLLNALDAARWTAYEALWKLDIGRDAADSVHLAKTVASEGYYEACNFAHEVHAGVGSMTEYGLTLHTTASRTLYNYLGDPKLHRRRLADALGL